jgi:hypothetical protein
MEMVDQDPYKLLLIGKSYDYWLFVHWQVY